jgi:hypothetical protein
MTMSIWRRRTVPLLLGVLLASGLIVAQPKPERAFAACDIANPTAQACIDTVTGQVDYWRNWSQPTIDNAVAAAQATAQQCLQDCQVLINSYVAEAQYFAGFAYDHTCGPGAFIVGWPSCEQLLANVIALVVQTGTSIVYGLIDQATRPDYPAELAATVTTLALAIVDIFVTIANNVVNLLMPTVQGAVAQAGAIVNPVVAQATGTVNGAVAQATGIVNPVVGQVQSIANDPLAAAQPVFGLVNSIVGTVQAVAASLQPTVDQATYTALQTVNGALTTLQGTVAFIASQVPDPNSVAAQVVALAYGQLPLVLQTVDQVESIALATAFPPADGERDTGGNGTPDGTPPTLDYVAVAAKVVAATQAEAFVGYALATYATPAGEAELDSWRCWVPWNPLVLNSSPAAAPLSAAPRSGCGPAVSPKPPPKYTEPSGYIDNHPLYVQQQPWSCGPSTGRAILKQLTGQDFGESNLYGDFGTTAPSRTGSGGTSRDGEQRGLNRRQSRVTFVGEPVKSPTDLMSRVALSVSGHDAEPPHAAALNLNHTVLRYWDRSFEPGAGHFNFVDGYNYHDGGYLRLGDGGKPSVANSEHTLTLADVYEALQKHTAGQGPGIVW